MKDSYREKNENNPIGDLSNELEEISKIVNSDMNKDFTDRYLTMQFRTICC